MNKCAFCKAEFDDDDVNKFIAHVKEIHNLNMYSYQFYCELFEGLAFGTLEYEDEYEE